LKGIEIRPRQRLLSFLLRTGKKLSGRTRWGRAFFNWLLGVKFESQVKQIVFQEYVDSAVEAGTRLKALDVEIENALEVRRSGSWQRWIGQS